MDMATFETQLKGRIVLVDFNASWCAPCRAMAPAISSVAQKFKARASVMEIDIDTHQKLATHYMVQSIPTLIFFSDGQEVKRLVGLQSEAVLEQNLTALIQAVC